jgi:hypothetical protein
VHHRVYNLTLAVLGENEIGSLEIGWKPPKITVDADRKQNFLDTQANGVVLVVAMLRSFRLTSHSAALSL